MFPSLILVGIFLDWILPNREAAGGDGNCNCDCVSESFFWKVEMINSVFSAGKYKMKEFGIN